jgi:hypothetical protein
MFSLAMVVPGSDSIQARKLCCTIPLLTNSRQVYRDRCSEQTHHTPFHRTHITSGLIHCAAVGKLLSEQTQSPPPVYPCFTDNEIKQISQQKSAQYLHNINNCNISLYISPLYFLFAPRMSQQQMWRAGTSWHNKEHITTRTRTHDIR